MSTPPATTHTGTHQQHSAINRPSNGSEVRDPNKVILAADVPIEVWRVSGVLCELVHHPRIFFFNDTATTEIYTCVDAALDVSILFGYSKANIKAARDFVVHGHIHPPAVRFLQSVFHSSLRQEHFKAVS